MTTQTAKREVEGRKPGRRRVWTFPITFVLALFMLAASRWGSYLHVPELSFYIGDLLLALSFLQLLFLRLADRLPLSPLWRGPWLMRLVVLLFAWTAIRFAFRTDVDLVALRDVAPYGYATAAVISYWLPVRRARHAVAAIYTVLTLHAAWFVTVTSGVLDPARLGLGHPAAQVFSTRPDFDSAVCAIAVGFALAHLLHVSSRTSKLRLALTIAPFLGLNAYGVLTQHSRSGLLSSLVTVVVVVGVSSIRRYRTKPRTGRASQTRLPIAIAAGSGAVLVLTALFTTPGQRLVDGVRGTPGESAGTTNARLVVYERVSEYMLDDPVRTGVGVGFGPDFLAASRSLNALEGTMYDNVRSPHNYLLGTWARLGTFGALIAALLLAAAGWAALRALVRRSDAPTRLAALVVIVVPVPAMLGVVLESPFGALPYFWAVGQLAAAGLADEATPRAQPAGQPAG